jgi:hypothetical protein
VGIPTPPDQIRVSVALPGEESARPDGFQEKRRTFSLTGVRLLKPGGW